MSLKVVIVGDERVARMFRDQRLRAKDVRPAWDKVEEYLSLQIREQFATQGAAMGTPWDPLKPEYLAWKIAHKYDPRILRRTGDMFSDLGYVPMGVSRKGVHRARFGTNEPYAVFHQRGTRNMAARPIIKATPQITNEVSRILLTYVAKGKG